MFALAAGLSILLVIALAAAMYIRAGVTPSTTDGEDRAAAGATASSSSSSSETNPDAAARPDPPPVPVDCAVEWTAWRGCNASCGDGTDYRHANVTVEPKHGGKACPALEETRPCNKRPCPVDCAVSDWTPWGPCPAKCGAGIHTRTRTVVRAAKHGGKACPALTESRTCYGEACPKYLVQPKFTKGNSCPAGYRPPTRSECEATEMGRKFVQIKPTNVPPMPGFSGEPKGCYRSDAAQTGKYELWWNPYVSSGDGGQSHDSAPICIKGTDPASAASAEKVPAPFVRGKSLGAGGCPVGYVPIDNARDCGLANRYPLSERAAESTSLNESKNAKYPNAWPDGCFYNDNGTLFNVNKGAYYDGKWQPYDPTHFPTWKPMCKLVPNVDCAVSDWTPWAKCSKECGDGTQVRTRSVTTKASGSGKACPVLSESRPCNMGACHDPASIGTTQPAKAPYAYGGVDGCPVGYSPVSKSGCTPGSIQIEGETFKSERRDETNQDYPMGCYTIKAGDPYPMYWNAATTSTAKDRGWEGFWDSVRRLCKRD